MGRDRVRVVSSAVAVLATAALLAGCGGGSQTATLNYYVFSEPSGSFAQAVSDCSKASGGRYKIVYNLLPQDANAQRQQLVRRLAAHDSAIDIIGMTWTGRPNLPPRVGSVPGPGRSSSR